MSERKIQAISARGLVPGSLDEPALYEDLEIEGLKIDERGRKRFVLRVRGDDKHTWTTLPITQPEEENYKKALTKRKS